MRGPEDNGAMAAAIGRGDREALHHLYASCKDDLLTLAACLLGDRHAAEDVLQDVFVSLVRRLGKTEFSGSLQSYLKTSCVNRCRDLLRQRARRHAVAAGSPCGGAPTPPADAAAEVADDSARSLAALASLPDEQREAVVLHIQGHMKFREIAEAQGVSINTVQSRYRLALQALRTVMNEKGDDR
jgi:RNA polymerase sigma-70 factor, ECF subfamily